MQLLLKDITLLGMTLKCSVICYNVRSEALEQFGLCIHTDPFMHSFMLAVL